MTTPETPEPQPADNAFHAKLGAVVGCLFVVALVYNLATSCNDDDTDPASSRTEPVTVSVNGGTVSSPADLIAAAGDTLPCSDPIPVTAPSGADAQVNCVGPKVIIRVYADTVATVSAGTAELLGKLGYDTLTGANWTISSLDSEYLRQAQGRIGGQIEAASSP